MLVRRRWRGGRRPARLSNRKSGLCVLWPFAYPKKRLINLWREV